MKNLFWLLSLSLLFSCEKASVDLSGEWEWVYTTEHNQTHQVRIQINKIDDQKTIGFYCSAYAFGEYVDCAQSDSPLKDTPNMILKPITHRSFEGSFRSNRGNETDQLGKIRFTYHVSGNRLFVDLLEEPASSFFFPDEVEFMRKQ